MTPLLASLTPSRFASACWKDLVWWKDISLLGLELGNVGDWFCNSVWRKVGNGESTSFRHDTWVGLQPLSRDFPR